MMRRLTAAVAVAVLAGCTGPATAEQVDTDQRLTPVVVDANPAEGARVRVWDSTDHMVDATPGQTVRVDRVVAVSVLTRAPDTPDAFAACAVRVNGVLVATDQVRIPAVYASCTWHA